MVDGQVSKTVLIVSIRYSARENVRTCHDKNMFLKQESVLPRVRNLQLILQSQGPA